LGVLKKLVEIGANIYEQSNGLTPFQIAEQHNHPNIVEYLIETHNRIESFLSASSCGDLERITSLYSDGCHLDVRDKHIY